MGGEGAGLEITAGGKNSFRLAALPADGLTGGYFHLDQPKAPAGIRPVELGVATIEHFIAICPWLELREHTRAHV